MTLFLLQIEIELKQVPWACLGKADPSSKKWSLPFVFSTANRLPRVQFLEFTMRREKVSLTIHIMDQFID